MKIREGEKIQLSGKQCSGKTTVSKYLLQLIPNTVIVSLAEPIYKISEWWEKYHKVDLSKIEFFSAVQEIKNLLNDIYETTDLSLYAENKILNNLKNLYPTKNWTFKDEIHRKMLQDIGDWLREVKRSCVIDNLIKRSNRLVLLGKSVICDDVRYEEEVFGLSHGGFTSIRLNVSREVQIERIKNTYGKVNYERLDHPSEVDLDNYKNFDYIVNASLPLQSVLSEIEDITVRILQK